MTLIVPIDRIEWKPARSFDPGSLLLLDLGQDARGALAISVAWRPEPDDPSEPMALLLQDLHERAPAGTLVEVKGWRNPVKGVRGPVTIELDLLSVADGDRYPSRGRAHGHLGIGPAGAHVSADYNPRDMMHQASVWVSTATWEVEHLPHELRPELAFTKMRLRLQGGLPQEPLTLDLPLAS